MISSHRFSDCSADHVSSNIGNDAKALWKHYDKNVTDEFLVHRQQMHVSTLSICSFLGRLLSGESHDTPRLVSVVLTIGFRRGFGFFGEQASRQQALVSCRRLRSLHLRSSVRIEY